MLASSPVPHEPSSSSPRVLRVYGCPLNSHGIGLKSTVRRACTTALRSNNQSDVDQNSGFVDTHHTLPMDNKNTDNSATSCTSSTCHERQSSDTILETTATASSSSFNVVFERSVHGRVVHGSCFIICASAETAVFLHDYFNPCLLQKKKTEVASPSSVLAPVILYEGVSLQVDYAAGKLRDHFFSKLPFPIRRQMRLDSEATFSVTDDESADRMTLLLGAMWRMKSCICSSTGYSSIASAAGGEGAVVMDAMCCVGGNTLSFAKYTMQLHKQQRSTLLSEQCCAIEQTNSNNAFVKRIVAVEADAQRYQMLTENLELVGVQHRRIAQTLPSSIDDGCTDTAAAVVCAFHGCLSQMIHIAPNETLLQAPQELTAGVRGSLEPLDIFFWDPPWGGPQYAAALAANGGDVPLQFGCGSSFLQTTVGQLIRNFAGLPHHAATSSSADTDTTSSSAPRIEQHFPIAPVIAVKLPSASSLTSTAFAEQLTAVPPLRRNQGEADTAEAERNFPFRFHFGLHTTLLVILVAGNTVRSSLYPASPPSSTTATAEQQQQSSPSLWYSNRKLDAVVASIMVWHKEIGWDEHRPEFYDYDKKRWIMLKKWIPAKVSRE